jgi:hypothetical protein
MTFSFTTPRRFKPAHKEKTMFKGWEKIEGWSKEDLEKFCIANPVLESSAHVIEDWSDYSFKTSDGRTFGLFIDSDSIKHRLLARCVHIIRQQREALESVAGFILEVGTTDPPLIFANREDLYKAWLQHHEMFGVPLSNDEREGLGLDVETDEDDD